MVAQPQERNDEELQENFGKRGNGFEEVTHKTRATIYNFLKEKERITRLQKDFSNKEKIGSEIVNKILSLNEKTEGETNEEAEARKTHIQELLKPYFIDTITIKKLKEQKIHEAAVLNLLTLKGISGHILENLETVIIKRIKEYVDKEKEKVEKELDNKNTRLNELKIKEQTERNQEKKQKLQNNIIDLENEIIKIEETNNSYDEVINKLNTTNLSYGQRNIKAFLESNFKNDLNKELLGKLKDNISSDFSFHDFVSEIDDNDEDTNYKETYNNFKEGVELRYINDSKYKVFTETFTALAFADLDEYNNITQNTITKISGLKLLEDKQVDLAFYFDRELSLYRQENSVTDDGFVENFYTYLTKINGIKASIFDKTFRNKATLSAEEQKKLIDFLRPAMAEYSGELFANPEWSTATLHKFYDNLDVPTSEIIIKEDGLDKAIRTTINVTTSGDDIFDSTIRFHLEINKDEINAYPNKETMMLPIVGKNNMVEIDYNKDTIKSYISKKVTISLEDGTEITGTINQEGNNFYIKDNSNKKILLKFDNSEEEQIGFDQTIKYDDIKSLKTNEIDLYKRQYVTLTLSSREKPIKCMIIGIKKDKDTKEDILCIASDSQSKQYEKINIKDIEKIERKNIYRSLNDISADIMAYENSEHAQEIRDTLIEYTNMEITEAFNSVDKDWNNLDGHGLFETGAVLHVSVGFSEALGKGVPFGYDYEKITFSNVNRMTGEIEVIASPTTNEGNVSRTTVNIIDCINGNGDTFIKTLKAKLGGKFFRLGKGLNSEDELSDYIKEKGKIEDIEGLDIPGEMKRLAKEGKIKDIAYIGIERDKDVEVKKGKKKTTIKQDDSLFFSVSFDGGMVQLSCTGGGFDKTMTYDEFLLFMCDKKLNPYTQEEFEESRQPKETSKKNAYLNMYSIANIIQLFKLPAEELKSKWKKRDDRLGTELYGTIIGSDVMKSTLGWVPYMNEVSQEADSRKQHRIKSLVGEYKKYFEENFEHDTAASIEIRDSIIQDEKTATKAHFKNRHKALGAYMYSASKDHIYFRETAKQAGNGYWVLAILGPKAYAQYKKEYSQRRKEIENKPNDDITLNDFTQFEMNFIKNNIGSSGLFPKSYGATLEGSRDQIWQKYDDGKNDMGNKSGYIEMRNSKESMLKNHRLSGWMGAEGQSMEPIREYMTYKELFMDNLYMSLSGHVNVRINDNMKNNFQNHMQGTGFAPAYYNASYGIYGGKRLSELLDIITTKVLKTEKFTTAVGYDHQTINFGNGKTGKDKVDYHEANLAMRDKMKKFWQEYGNEMVEILNMTNFGSSKSLFALLENSELSEKERKAIEEYIEKAAIQKGDDKGKDFVLKTLHHKNYCWKANVMNYPDWLRKYLFAVDSHGVFLDNTSEWSNKFWLNITETFNGLVPKYKSINPNHAAERDAIRTWGTEKILQLLGKNKAMGKDLELLIKAKCGPESGRKEAMEEFMKRLKKDEVQEGVKNLNLKNEEQVRELTINKLFHNTVYNKVYNNTIKTGLISMSNFLETLK